MTATDQDLRAIAHLMARVRQDLHGAGEWDEAGIMAALRKVQGLRLADVTLAAIRAADDRNAKSPGVLSAPGSLHWRERNHAEQTAPRRPWDRGTHCSTCSEPEDRCRARWADDHEFTPAAKAAHGVSMPDNVRELLPQRPAKPTDRRPWVPESEESAE